MHSHERHFKTIHFLGNGFDYSAIVTLEERGIVVGGAPVHFLTARCVLCEDDETLLQLIEQLGLLLESYQVSTISMGSETESVEYNTIPAASKYVSSDNVYGIIDDETATINGLPTQIIIQQAIVH